MTVAKTHRSAFGMWLALERGLEIRSRVDRLAVRDQHVLEVQLEQLAQRRQRARRVLRRGPHAQLAAGRGQPVGEDERALLGQVERRLHHPAAVVEREQPAGQLVAGAHRLELDLRDVAAPEQRRAERAGAVPAHEQVDVADVVGLEDHDRVGVEGVDALPRVAG